MQDPASISLLQVVASCGASQEATTMSPAANRSEKDVAGQSRAVEESGEEAAARKRASEEEEAARWRAAREVARNRAAEEAAQAAQHPREEAAAAAADSKRPQAAQAVARAAAASPASEAPATAASQASPLRAGPARAASEASSAPRGEPPAGPPLAAELAARLKPDLPDQSAGDGPIWIVVGGRGKGGIMVRKGESLTSKPLPVRLAPGTRVEELEVSGDRLHYKRIRGNGPDFGWVSVEADGRALLEREV
ncbi:unnamed protein product [Prorocentrum cordatum]|uniref:SH3 domain-containing protein n=1 Tax=Prorocentrum cordatum TaxID=2364126 RepID=A0ABN9W9K3_9DINO|nr:unnamed protein product [Polarella glacialis]